MKVEVTELSHEEIANILEVAQYANNAITIQRPKEFQHLVKPNHEYGNERQADVLLGGGYIVVWDNYAEADSLDDKLSSHAFDIDKDGSIAYRMTLEQLLQACSDDVEEAAGVIRGDGDLYNAWNIIQRAIFGDIIYG